MKADIVVDIETIANPATTQEIEAYMATIPTVEQTMAEYKAPSNWKDPVKLEAHRTKAYEKAVAEYASASEGALTAVLDKRRFDIGGKRMISCALGVANRFTNQVENIECKSGEDLNAICNFIVDYLDEYPEKRLIGFNHLGFDMPEIMKSAALCNSRPLRVPLGKWDFVDLSAFPYKKNKLKDSCAAFGFPLHEADGSSVASFYEAGNWEKIEEYNKHDVLITGKLYLATARWIQF